MDDGGKTPRGNWASRSIACLVLLLGIGVGSVAGVGAAQATEWIYGDRVSKAENSYLKSPTFEPMKGGKMKVWPGADGWLNASSHGQSLNQSGIIFAETIAEPNVWGTWIIQPSPKVSYNRVWWTIPGTLPYPLPLSGSAVY